MLVGLVRFDLFGYVWFSFVVAFVCTRPFQTSKSPNLCYLEAAPSHAKPVGADPAAGVNAQKAVLLDLEMSNVTGTEWVERYRVVW